MGTASYDYSDETVVITGGASGIGRAAAIRFGEAGANVIVADIQREPRDVDTHVPTDEAIVDVGGSAAFIDTDVSDPAAISAVVEAAREFGGVDVMINNAGRYIGKPFLEVDPEDLEALLRVNVYGVFLGCQIAAQDMIERGVTGSIINTASISSELAQLEQVQYDATKGAVKMITRGAALSLAAHEIRVNAIAPGQIATEFIPGLTTKQQELADAAGHYKPIPLGRAGHPTDLAGAYLFLASDDAEYITGEMLFVDGGWQIV